MTTQPHKILVVGPSWVGDTMMAQSLFKLLHTQQRPVEIDVLAPAWTFSLLSCMPEVASAIEMPITHGEFKLRERLAIGKACRNRGYHQAIVLPNSFKSALTPWWAGIPQRTGFLGEGRFWLLNDIRRRDKKRYPLMVEQYLSLGLPPRAALPSPYPLPALTLSSDKQQESLAKFSIALTPAQPVLALCAGAEFGPSKRWPAEFYAEVANQKIKEGWAVWLFGSIKDQPITQRIMDLTNQQCLHLAGRLLLAETVNLLSVTTGVLTNDSGLMHIAAALQKPVVAIYGSTSPAFTPPLGRETQIIQTSLPCQPCFKRECPLKHYRCLYDLSPQQIITAIAKWNT